MKPRFFRLFVFLVAGLALACSEEREASPREHEASASYPPTAQVHVHDQLVADRLAPRHASDGGGSARLVLAEGVDGSIRCGERGRWTLKYTAGPLGVAVGGSVALLVPPFWGWSTPQVEAPARPGFTQVECEAPGVELEVFTADQSLLMVMLRGRDLREGETLRFVYGAGPAGATADTYSERESTFTFKVDGDGDGVSGLVEDAPKIDILPGPVARVAVTLPTTAEPGTDVELRLALLDAFANLARSSTGTVELAVDSRGLELPERVEITASAGGVALVEVQCNAPGTFRVTARLALADGTELSQRSNPLRVQEGIRPVYWADLHGHSGLSDGTGTPEDYLAYARDVSGLDVIALTDHDHFGVRFLDQHPELWERIRAATEEAHDPGHFIALLGYEWTSWLYGHRHVLYFQDEGAIHSSIDETTTTPEQLWEALEGQDALTFAHHSAGGPVAVDWSFVPDPRIEPVTEIMSVHGSSEAWDSPSRIYSPLRGNFVRDQLDRGLRFGFIGSGDSHDGHPGHAHLSPLAGFRRTPPDPRGRRAAVRQGHGGLAAIRAGELSRGAVLEALRARDVYATSGPRIWLATSLAGRKMGSDVAAADVAQGAQLVLAVSGTEGIEYVEVVQRGRPVQRFEADGELDLLLEVSLTEIEKGDYIYVRVLQRDGGLAWSSPFYIS